MISWGKVLEAAVGLWEGGWEEPRRRSCRDGEGHLPGSWGARGSPDAMDCAGKCVDPGTGRLGSGGLFSGHRGGPSLERPDLEKKNWDQTG